MPSVLQTWVCDIPMRQQGVLVIALRGPDGVRKEDAAKPLVRTLRALVLNSGREMKPMEKGMNWKADPFMSMSWISDDSAWLKVGLDFFAQWDAYNVHFLQHLIHAFAVVGIHHPDIQIRENAWYFYCHACHVLHVHNETKEEIEYRLRDGVREGE